MSVNGPVDLALTEQRVEKLVKDWYLALDQHLPPEHLRSFLADEGLEMRFPEATVQGHDGFTGWYQAVVRRFFDEDHDITGIEVHGLPSSEATVAVEVDWRATMWEPPAARSTWLGFHASQTWHVVSGADGSPLITSYVVDALTPMEGSAHL